MKESTTLIICAVLLTACTTRTQTIKVSTPNGEMTETATDGPYSHDRTQVIDSNAAYNDCLEQLNVHDNPAMEMYCRNATSAGPVGGNGYGYGSGYGMPGMGLYDSGLGPYPTDNILPANRAMQRSAVQSAIVNVPMYEPMYLPTVPGYVPPAPPNDDMVRVIRKLNRMDKAVCDLQQAQNQDCDQQQEGE